MKKGKSQATDPKCISINLILCGDVLKKVLGKVGYNKVRTGIMGANKRSAIYELIASNPFVPTEEHVRAGIELNASRQR